MSSISEHARREEDWCSASEIAKRTCSTVYVISPEPIYWRGQHVADWYDNSLPNQEEK